MPDFTFEHIHLRSPDPEATAVRPVPPPLLPAPAWQYRPGTPEADLLPSERPYVPLPPPASRPAHGNLAGSRGVIILLVLLVILTISLIFKSTRIGLLMAYLFVFRWGWLFIQETFHGQHDTFVVSYLTFGLLVTVLSVVMMIRSSD